MSTRPRRPLRAVTAAFATALSAGLVLGLSPTAPAATAERAPATTGIGSLGLLPLGLEDVVGTIAPVLRAQLPLDPKLYGPYSLRPTPTRCADGSWSCIDVTIRDMTNRFNRLAPTCDHDAVFSLLYLRVTERYKTFAKTKGNFTMPKRVNYENAVFSDLYTGAWDDWHAGRPATVPPIWRLAFAAADERQVSGSGDAFLGMAAHILRDLPFALWRIQLGARADHLAINRMLQSVYNDAVSELAERFDPTMSAAAIVPGTDKTLVALIAEWRDQGWRNAQDLLAAPDRAAYAQVANRIERDAWATGVTLYLGTKYPVQQATVVRDAYCAANWNA